MKKIALLSAGALALAVFAATTLAAEPTYSVTLNALRSSYIVAGDRVDLLASYRVDGEWVTETVLVGATVSDVKVAAASELELVLSIPEEGGPRLAAAALKQPVFTAALRSPKDMNASRPEGVVSFSKLLLP